MHDDESPLSSITHGPGNMMEANHRSIQWGHVARHREVTE
jgi:hypothetical protein